MPETVGIVLNERESLKAETAEQLEAILASKGITSFRYEIGSKIKETLYQKRPPILVLDYILGDYSTGLDVLEALQDISEEDRPSTFFLTDEPSASVATTAMRSGAKHFLDIGNPRSLPELVAEIEYTRRQKITPSVTVPTYDKMNDLIFESQPMQLLQAQLQVESSQCSPLPLFYGDNGVGKETLAMAYAQSAGLSPHAFSRTDLRFSLESPNRTLVPRVGSHGALLVHVEADDGEYLEMLASKAAYLQKIRDSYMVIGTTSDAHTAKAWSDLVGSTVFHVPALSDRSEDFSAFIQKFTREAASILGTKCSPPTSKMIDSLTEKSWPNGLTQLREVILYSHQYLKEHDGEMSEVLEKTYARSTEYYSLDDRETTQPSRTIIQSMLEKHRYRYRVVAAKLGMSVNAVHEVLQKESAA